MSVTDDELEAERERIASLKEDIEDATVAGAAALRDAERELELRQLKAEAERLELVRDARVAGTPDPTLVPVSVAESPESQTQEAESPDEVAPEPAPSTFTAAFGGGDAEADLGGNA